MAEILTTLGLRANTLGLKVPSYAPHFVIANFVLSYALLSTRGSKTILGLDHNVCPREDLIKYGDRAVKDGKLTQAALNKLKRREAAHANAVENFPLLIGAVILALQAKLPNELINKYAFIYTVVRVLYAVAYAEIETASLSYLRSVLWWAGNITCFRLLWFSKNAMNL